MLHRPDGRLPENERFRAGVKKSRKKRTAQAGLCDYANAPTTSMLSTRDTSLTCAFKSPLVFLKRYEFPVFYSVAEDFLNKTTKISRHSIPSERSSTIDRRALGQRHSPICLRADRNCSCLPFVRHRQWQKDGNFSRRVPPLFPSPRIFVAFFHQISSCPARLSFLTGSESFEIPEKKKREKDLTGRQEEARRRWEAGNSCASARLEKREASAGQRKKRRRNGETWRGAGTRRNCLKLLVRISKRAKHKARASPYNIFPVPRGPLPPLWRVPPPDREEKKERKRKRDSVLLEETQSQTGVILMNPKYYKTYLEER